MGTRPWIVDDELWVLIEPLLPPRPERSPGPRPVSDRLCLQGILFVLYNDMAWQLLPPELGFGSGQTCWRRLDRWQKAGVFDRLHRVLLAELNAAGELDWSRACVDCSRIRAKKGGTDTGPSPVDRRETGSKHHLICDGRGTPLQVITTAANVNDVNQTLALVDGVPPAAGRPDWPRRRPEALLGGKGYDSNAHRDELRRRRILPVISRALRSLSSRRSPRTSTAAPPTCWPTISAPAIPCTPRRGSTRPPPPTWPCCPSSERSASSPGSRRPGLSRQASGGLVPPRP
ncbi:IS5 family transposase [Streptomyces sp. NPDC087228]|uniref:IS5 family transposase n=1 Tax=Streptomyces sp. NPDC087228 TaxID=3365772 RepID=UPI00382A1DEC